MMPHMMLWTAGSVRVQFQKTRPDHSVVDVSLPDGPQTRSALALRAVGLPAVVDVLADKAVVDVANPGELLLA